MKNLEPLTFRSDILQHAVCNCFLHDQDYIDHDYSECKMFLDVKCQKENVENMCNCLNPTSVCCSFHMHSYVWRMKHVERNWSFGPIDFIFIRSRNYLLLDIRWILIEFVIGEQFTDYCKKNIFGEVTPIHEITYSL